MRDLKQAVLNCVGSRPEGSSVCAKELLHLGTRAAVDQALSRLAREGKLMRSGRGLYVQPIESRFGVRAPSPEKFIAEMARLRGETIAPSGAAAANALGLTTQVPVRQIYLTSGPSRRLQLGAQTVELRHAPRWQLIKSGEPAGEVLRALAWLGKSKAQAGLSTLKRTLPETVLTEIARSRALLPEWLAQSISHELINNG